MAKKQTPIRVETIEKSILTIHVQRVILDANLAAIYGVTTARLNQQVRRNRDRFPDDFAYALTQQEVAHLMLQNATSSSSHGGRRKPPFVFTEYGAVMAANVLNSPTAIHASILVVRAFVRMREMLNAHTELARKVDEMEKKYDGQFKIVFDAFRQLMNPPESPRRQIGFHAKLDSDG
jgi:hypothetical protein